MPEKKIWLIFYCPPKKKIVIFLSEKNLAKLFLAIQNFCQNFVVENSVSWKTNLAEKKVVKPIFVQQKNVLKKFFGPKQLW